MTHGTPYGFRASEGGEQRSFTMFRWSLIGRLVLSVTLLVLVWQGSACVQPKESGSRSADSSDVAEGRVLVRGYCSQCHGLDAKGARAPDLSQRVLRHANSEEALARIIVNGIPATGMAGFKWFPERFVEQVVSFIQYQRTSQEPDVIPGDPHVGKGVFEQHRCATCHWTGKDGGRRGPDLSLSRSPLEYIRQKLIDPSADPNLEYQQVILVTKEGEVLQGMRLSENSFYIQLIDENERLHTIAKTDISELKRPSQSLMPSYKKELNPAQMDNLIAYLFSLRKA